jgi:NAD-reducing hydrogenase large subunit
MDAPPAERNVFGLLKGHEAFVRDGIRLRQFGQTIIEELAGKRIHPSWVVPGGVNAPLDAARRDRILARIPEALAIVRRALERGKAALETHREEIRTFANFPSLFLGLVDEKGMLEHTDGTLRVVDAHGKIVADGIDPRRYREHLAEAVEPDSFLKSPYWRAAGYPDGMYRVGPLARLNVADGCGTPLADQEWAEFRNLDRGAVLSSFHYHWARLIEILYGVERIERLLLDPDILSLHVRAVARANNLDGVGVSEAPRGLLIHHYRIDDDGLVKWANFVIATGHNNLAMNRGILQAARHFLSGKTITEGLLNRVEAVIRAFDPCLSCSTHALGKMPLAVDLVDGDGALLDRRVRS